MPLTARTLARALGDAAAEAKNLARFLDDLDGWDGFDCDTGTNAARTLAAMHRAADRLDGESPFFEALDAVVEAGIGEGRGHIGVILTALFAGWSRGLDGATALTPVVIRRMLKTDPRTPLQRSPLSDAVVHVLETASKAADDLGDTLPTNAYLVSWYSLAAQEGLVAATNERTGRIDAGASVLTIVFACFDVAVGQDPSVLESLARMLSELADSGGRAVRQHSPSPERAFTVDAVWQGTEPDALALFDAIEAMGARLSCAGAVDPLGVGLWRLHVDTSAPLAARPRTGRLIRFAIADARPDEELGVDELDEDVVTHRGVRLLERRPLRRVERARVLACTRAPGLVEDLARTGAVVLLDPNPEDAAGILAIASATPTGVCLLAPCDEASANLGAALARAAQNAPEPATILLADSTDDLAALAVAHACAGLFVPQPGGRAVADTLAHLLSEGAASALQTSLAQPLPDDERAAGVVAELARRTPGSWRLLVAAGDGPDLVALVRQIVAHESPWAADVEVVDGGQAGPSLLQAVGA